MSIAAVIAALGLPDRARVDRRVPKKTLLEQALPGPADRRLLGDAIADLLWVASLKPETIGLPAFRDTEREYAEIAVVAATLRAARRAVRVAELLHRAIPYPVLLVATAADSARVSIAHKRTSRGEDGRFVADEVRTTAPFDPATPDPAACAFLRSLALASAAAYARDLFELYDAWAARIDALAAAAISGEFRVPPPSPTGGAAGTREAVASWDEATRELASLRSRAGREPGIARRIDLNLAIQRLEARRSALKDALRTEEPR